MPRHMIFRLDPDEARRQEVFVSYCLGITTLDPVKYNLVFERFLNPERVSMPDIDVDFAPEGRQKVIDYVIEKIW